MTITRNVQIIVEESTPYGDFRDAIYIPESEIGGVSDEEITAMAQERVDSWIEAVTGPPVDGEE